jgi:hypothetical protein
MCIGWYFEGIGAIDRLAFWFLEWLDWFVPGVGWTV